MMQTFRPGVYSEYNIQNNFRKNGNRAAFFCGPARRAEGASLPAGGVVKLSSMEQLTAYFDPENGGETFFQVCRILLQNGAPAVYAVPITVDGSAAELSGYRKALASLTELKHTGVLVCASGEPAVLQEMKLRILDCSMKQREKLGVAAVPKGQALSVAGQINCERILLCCQKAKTPDSGEAARELYTAAEVAGKLAAAGPGENLNGLTLDGLSEAEALSEEEVESLLGGGVTVVEAGRDGVPECIRMVTTRTMTAGQPDRTFSSVNTILCIDDILQTARDRLEALLKGAPAGSFTLDGIASQLSILLDEKQEQGLVTDFEPPVVYRDSSDPEVCVAELEFHLASVVSQIYLTAHISI